MRSEIGALLRWMLGALVVCVLASSPASADDAATDDDFALTLDDPSQPTEGATQSTTPSPTHAPSLVLEPPAPRYRIVEERRWYGHHTLLVDGSLILLAVLAAGAESGELAGLAGIGYLIGGPIVHAAHGSGGRAVVSLLLRLGLPLAFAGIGVATNDCDGGYDDDGEYDGLCNLGSVVIGGALGMLTAIIVDAAVVAHETVKKRIPVEPVALLRPDGLYLGARGSF